MDHDRDLVTLRKFDSEVAAQLLRQFLNENGVPATVAGMTPYDGLKVIDSIQLNVRKIDEERARELIADFESSRKAIPAWKCSCGEQVDEGFSQCWNCQADFPGTENAQP